MHKHRHADRARSRDIPLWCLRYAQQGAKDGLIAFCERDWEPNSRPFYMVLERTSQVWKPPWVHIKRTLKSPVLEFLAAKIGPDLDAIVKQIDERLDEADVPRPPMIDCG